LKASFVFYFLSLLFLAHIHTLWNHEIG
jgi:hypothetical protein